MQNTTLLRPSISKRDKNWYSEEEISLIKQAAFDRGYEHFTETQITEYTDNLLKAQSKASDFFDEVHEKLGIELKQIRLKPVSLHSFEFIFIMNEIDFYTRETYRKVYNCGLEFIDKNDNDDISITFLYMPYSENINENELILDGFVLTYDPFRQKN